MLLYETSIEYQVETLYQRLIEQNAPLELKEPSERNLLREIIQLGDHEIAATLLLMAGFNVSHVHWMMAPATMHSPNPVYEDDGQEDYVQFEQSAYEDLKTRNWLTNICYRERLEQILLEHDQGIVSRFGTIPDVLLHFLCYPETKADYPMLYRWILQTVLDSYDSAAIPADSTFMFTIEQVSARDDYEHYLKEGFEAIATSVRREAIESVQRKRDGSPKEEGMQLELLRIQPLDGLGWSSRQKIRNGYYQPSLSLEPSEELSLLPASEAGIVPQWSLASEQKTPQFLLPSEQPEEGIVPQWNLASKQKTPQFLLSGQN